MLIDQIPAWADSRLRQGRANEKKISRAAIAFFAASLGWNLIIPGNLMLYVGQMIAVQGWAKIGMAMKEFTPPHLTLYLANAGAIPFFSELTAHDSMGLSDPKVSHEKKVLGKALAGHEKIDLTRIRDLNPSLIFVSSYAYNTDLEGFVGDMKKIGVRRARRRKRLKDENIEIDPLRRKSMKWLLTDDEIMKRYQPMELAEPALRALFLVKRSEAPLLKDGYLSIRTAREKK
jgi:hypothetical protein